MNDNYSKAKLKPLYDSDEDLSPEAREKVRQAGTESRQADKVRQEEWDKADLYSKTKKLLKTAWGGDKRSKE